AAASTEGAHYAYNFINKVELKEGHKVLVNGATGAIGSAAVQLLKYFGANITAVCESRNSGLVKLLGANNVIDYTKEDFTKSGEKYNFVFDTVGKSTFGKCKPILTQDGIYISSEPGTMAQNVFFSLITPIFGKKQVKFPMPYDPGRSARFIKDLIEKKKFRAVIDKNYPLEQIADAFEYVEKGQKIGSVVITIDHNKN
ncbi:NAD(P)-dependent alcohol dehydrogenase, partial [Spirochaetota bacterium]